MEAVTHFRHGLVEHLDGGERCFEAEFGSEPLDLGIVGFGGVQQQFRTAPDGNGHDVAEVAEQLFGQLSDFNALMERVFQFGQRRRRIAVYQVRRQLRESTGAGGAEHLMDVFHRDSAGGERQQLFQQRLTIAHRAGGATAKQPERFLVGLEPFGLYDQPQPIDDRFGGDGRKIESLAPRQDGDRNLFRVGGAEDEFDVFGRLFERLEERVEGRRRQHVDFVDDVDLEPRAAGTDVDIRPQLADFLDTAVARAVDL